MNGKKKRKTFVPLSCAKTDCTSYKNGCIVLKDNNFNGKPCPFYKSREEITESEEVKDGGND